MIFAFPIRATLLSVAAAATAPAKNLSKDEEGSMAAARSLFTPRKIEALSLPNASTNGKVKGQSLRKDFDSSDLPRDNEAPHNSDTDSIADSNNREERQLLPPKFEEDSLVSINEQGLTKVLRNTALVEKDDPNETVAAFDNNYVRNDLLDNYDSTFQQNFDQMSVKQETVSKKLQNSSKKLVDDIDGDTSEFDDSKELGILDSGQISNKKSSRRGLKSGKSSKKSKKSPTKKPTRKPTQKPSKCQDMRPKIDKDSDMQALVRSCLETGSSSACPYDAAIECWDTSEVTDMSRAFQNVESFNQNLDLWDTSAVTNMLGMFWDAIEFNQSLDKWDISAVTTMNSMFRNAYEFNGSIKSWKTSAVVEMDDMFYSAESFNQPIGSWDVSSVKTMWYMFSGCIDEDKRTKFNQPLASWDVSSVTNMEYMFQFGDFNQPLDSWDVSSVTDFGNMFNRAYSFNQCLSAWDSKIEDDARLRRIFEDTDCPYSSESTPGLGEGPWCQGEQQQCFIGTRRPTRKPSKKPSKKPTARPTN